MIVPWIMNLPTEGAAWDGVKKVADGKFDTARLSTRNQHHNQVLANAYVGWRLGSLSYTSRVRDELRKVMTTQPDLSDVLGSSRKLAGYMIAFYVAGIADNTFNTEFKIWAQQAIRTKYSGGGGGGTIIEVHERRPNNWQHAGASRIAVDLVTGDVQDLERAIKVHKGMLGDRTAYDGFEYGELWWQADPKNPVGINPKGATLQGHSVDGVIPDDLRRGNDSGQPDGFVWPPPHTPDADGIQYSWECLQSLTLITAMLCEMGYAANLWSDSAVLRAAKWLYAIGAPAAGDDAFTLYLLNYLYPNSKFPVFDPPIRAGKNFAFTDWTHSNRSLTTPTPLPPSPVNCDEVIRERDALQTQNKNLSDKVGVLESSLKGTQIDITALKDDINILNGRNINLQTRLAEIKALATLG